VFFKLIKVHLLASELYIRLLKYIINHLHISVASATTTRVSYKNTDFLGSLHNRKYSFN